MQPRILRPWRFGALLLAVPLATALSALPAASQTITYQVEFEGNWTLASTPGGVVGGAHFTTLIGGVHGSGVTFWESGGQASAGVENVAELGSTGTFRNEVQASSHTLSVIQEGVTGTGTGTATFNIDVTRTHPLVTLLSMIGPSPDWFVGVSGVSLLDGSDQWRESHVVDLFPYDAGTEDGTEFTLSNPATNPQGVITSIKGTGKFSDVRMARLTFTRMTTPPPTPTVSLSVSPNPVDEGQSVTVTAELSAALSNSVTIPLALTAGTAESGDFGSLASITITGGLTTGTGTISTTDDSDTDDETFTVALGTLPTEVTAGNTSSVVVTIRDGDSPPPPPTPTVSLSVSPNPVDEGQPVTVTAELSEALSNSVTIPLELTAGTAESDDFGSLASITIAGGQTTGTGTISTTDDADTDDETFTVALGTLPTEVTAGSPSSVVVTIRDGDSPPPPPTPTNNPPTVQATCQPCTVPRGGEVRLTAAASDPDGDPISYGWSAAQGTFAGATDGQDARWTAPDRIGTFVIRVAVADGRGGTAAAEVVVEVGNRLPVFGPSLRFEIAENRDGRGTPISLGGVRVTDPDGDDFELGLVSGSDRFVIEAASGALSYIGPGEDFETGPNRYTLTVMATDALGGVAQAEVVVEVVDVNEHPVATDDTVSVAEDGRTRADVLANDDDPDRGDRIRVVSVGAPGHGQAQVVDAGAAVRYVPDPSYHGPDRFTYVVADAGGLADTATVEVTVTPVNDAPEAADDQATTPEDEAVEIPVLVNDTDLDGDRLHVQSVSSAGHGAAEVAADGTSVSYVPDPNYHGPDRFTYVVADAGGLADTATVEVTVTPVNDAPEAADDQATTREDEAIEIPVLDNDADLDGDRLRVQSVSSPQHGAAEVVADGTNVTYLPDPNYHGPDRFTYVVADAGGLADTATVEVTVTPVNDAPQAADDQATTPEDEAVEIPVLDNDTDLDGDRLRVQSVSPAGHGTAEVAADGTHVTYLPDPNYHGPDRFTYIVADAGGLADTATVDVTVTPVNDAPEAVDDQATTPEDEAVEIPVLDNDTDLDGDPLRVQSASPAQHGTAEVAPDGTNVTYVPDPNYHGPDRFTYVIADADGLADTATVDVTVTPVNDGPQAADDQATTPEDKAVEIPVLDNDTDLDGDRLRVQSVSPAQHGTAEVAADGTSVSYVPDPNYHGSDRFTYVVADAGGLADTATVEVTVTPVNDAPEAADDRATTPEDEAVEIPVLDNDTDLDGDPLRVQSVWSAQHGTAEVAADGTNVTYLPDPNYHGPDRFTYVVTDAGGLADTATVEVTVTPVNDGPTPVGAIPDQLLDEGDDGVTVDLTPFFTDIDGDPLAFSAETSDADIVTTEVRGAVLVLVPVVYGDATVIVTATDPGGLAATQRVTVGVSDRLGRAVLSDAFAAMARSYLSSARMTLERRVAPGAHTAGTGAGRQSGLRVGGRSVELPDGHTFWDAAKQIVTGWLPDPEGMMNRFAHSARPAPGTELSLSDLAPAGVANPLTHLRPPAGISGTDFTFGWGGQTADSARPGVAWSLWGQTDVQRYDGGDDELGPGLAGISADYNGDLRVGYLGLDAQLPSWLFGVALGSSRGAGDWNAGAASGRLSTSMTSVHPYVRWSGGATTVWTTFGAGRGEARNERTATGRVGESPLDLAMGLVDFQRRLGPAGGPVAFGLRADAGWASLSTGEGTETIDDLRGRVHQARLGIDVRSEMRVGGAGLAPFGAVHLRNDGGDGQTGRGVELSGGLRAQLGFIGLDMQGRWLAYHSATSYGESGAGLTLTVGGREAEGFSLSASPHWGGQTRGGFALWQDRAPGMTPGPDAPPADWTMDVRGAYRARLGGQLLEVATAYDRASGGHRLQLTGHIGLGPANHR